MAHLFTSGSLLLVRRFGLALLLAAGLPLLGQAQSAGVGIGTTAPNARAALEIVSSSKGLLIPRLTATERGNIAAPVPAGLLVYQTDGAQPGFWYYAASGGWTFLTPTDSQTLSKSGSTISLTNGGSVTDSDNQSLSINGSTISLTNGGAVTVPSSADNLGNHTATQNLNLGTSQLVGNGGSSGISILSNGNVGVGNTTPAQKLDVVGNAAVTGATTMTAPSGAALTSSVLQVNGNQGATPVADQTQSTFPTTGALTDLWQSFTAGNTGVLSRIALYVGSGSTMGTLSIYTGQGTGGTLLYSQAASYSGSVGMRTLVLSSSVPVTAGQQYTFRLQPITATVFGQSTTDPYAGGRASTGAGNDLCFVTYLTDIATNALAVLTNGQVGIGTTTPTQALDVNGTTRTTALQVTGGTPTAGKVLTADASGNATWQAAPVGEATTASNGLTLTGTNVTLGGTLTGATSVAQAGNNLVISGGNVGIGTTAAPTVPLQVGNTTPTTTVTSYNGTFGTNLSSSATATASSVYDANNAVANIKDGNLTTEWSASNATGQTMPQWVQYDFGATPKTVRQYRMYYQRTGDDEPKAWQLQGSDNATAWTTLHTVTAAPNAIGWQTYAVPTNTTAYRYYRLLISSAQVATRIDVAFAEWEVMEENTTTVVTVPTTVRVSSGGLQLAAGSVVTEFSADGTLADNSDNAVPTEKAVKTYVGTYVAANGDNLGNHTATTTVKLNNQWLSNDGGAEGIRVDNSGNVGVGLAPLTANRLAVVTAGTGVQPVLMIRNSAGGSATGAALDFQTYDPVGSASGARIQAVDNGAFSATLSFLTKQSGANANGLVERMRISPTGNVGIGNTNPQVALDVNGGVRLSAVAGTGTRMVTADNLGNLGSDALPTDAQTLSISGGNLAISGGNTVPLTSLDAQQLTKSGSTISLTNGGSVPDADNQDLTLTGAALSISGGTGVTLPDASATNELQTISKAGTTVTLSNGGGTFTDADNQTLSISGSTISLTNGGSVTVPSSADNLGNHTATQALNLAANQLVGNGGTSGLAITNGGNVGIGITSAPSRLSVAGSSAGAVLPVAMLRNSAGGTNSGVALDLQTYDPGSNDPGARLQAVDNGSFGAEVAILTKQSGANANALVDRVHIAAGGSVGIGVAVPTQQLDVNGGILARTNSAISVQGAYLQWNRTNGEGETWLLNQKGNGAANAGIRFGSTTTANVVTEWARFRDDGNFGIGTTNPGQKLSVNGNICYTGSIGACSDRRYKERIEPLHSALASVLRLRGVTYFWRRAEFPDKQFGREQQLGFIAQEIEQLYPQMVQTGADGYKSVDYGRLTPVLVEAIKEQQAQIEALKARATTAETRAAQATAATESFEARLRALEAGGGQARK